MNTKSNLTALLLFTFISLQAQLQKMDPPQIRPPEKIVQAEDDLPQEESQEEVVAWHQDKLLGTNINLYQLGEFVAEEGEASQLKEFPILNQVALNDEEVGKLKALLRAPEQYQETDYVQQCFFLPNIGVELALEENSTILLFSFKCQQIRLYEGEEYQTINLNHDNPALKEFCMTFFPQEEKEEKMMGLTQLFEQEEEMMSMGLSPEVNEPKPLTYEVQVNDQWETIIQHIFDATCIKMSLQQLCNLNNLPIDQINNINIGDKLLVRQ